MNMVIIQVLPFLNNPKDLDATYRMDTDFWDCFGRKKLILVSSFLSNKENECSHFVSITDIKRYMTSETMGNFLFCHIPLAILTSKHHRQHC